MLFINKIVLTKMRDDKQTYLMYIKIENLNNKTKKNKTCSNFV
jgi:hypothetical protein